MTTAALRCHGCLKVLVISKTSLWPVSHDDADRISPFDDTFHDFSVFINKLLNILSFDEKGCPTAGFWTKINDENTELMTVREPLGNLMN